MAVYDNDGFKKKKKNTAFFFPNKEDASINKIVPQPI